MINNQFVEHSVKWHDQEVLPHVKPMKTHTEKSLPSTKHKVENVELAQWSAN